MNIKYISLLSFFCAMTIHAAKPSLPAMFDLRKKELKECGSDLDCKEKRRLYELAKLDISNFCKKQEEKELQSDPAKRHLSRKEGPVLIFERLIYREFARSGLDSLYDDSNESFEDCFLGSIRYDGLSPESRDAFRQASQNVLESIKKQPAEDSE